MDVIEAIHTRRSIRKYTDQDVSEDQIRQLLEAAMMAPSAGNEQPWHFIVIRDKTTLEKVKDINPFAGMAPKAPVAVLVCADLSLEKYDGYWVQDCSAAVQNILLAAHGLGLGAVWTGVYPDKDRVPKFSELFQLPQQVIPLGLIVLGHPVSQPNSKSRFNPDRVHQETW